MSRPREYDRMLNSMRSFFRLVGQGSTGASVAEFDGVVAAVSPAIPERSLPNSVVYESPGQLVAALPELARVYAEAGVRAWTVWTPEDDADAIAALEEAGHTLDGTPAAMAADLARLGPAPELDYRTGDLMDEIGPLNDAAYGGHDDRFARMAERWPPGATHDYVAEVDGEPASAVVVLDVDGDASVYCVAALERVRGRGLTRRLLHRALVDARERGCDISTLQATRLGEPVYTRLGYRRLGAIQMWERRT